MADYASLIGVTRPKETGAHFMISSFVNMAAIAIAFLVQNFAECCAQTRSNIPEVRMAWEMMGRGDCKAAWNVLWPLAKRGNAEVRYTLWMMSAVGLVPPGENGPDKPTNRYFANRNGLVLAAYAADMLPKGPPGSASVITWPKTEMPILINQSNMGSAGDQVSRCYKSNLVFHGCLRMAISLSLIPRFGEYAKELEAAVLSGGGEAYCRERPW